MPKPPDEHAAVIEPRKGKREESLPSAAIMIFTPQDLELFLRCFPQAPKISHRFYLANAYTGLLGGVPVSLVGPMLGAPQAVLVLERLIALGVRDVVAVGWCGSIQHHVKIGDIVLPDGALCEEGTSAHYAPSPSPPTPSPELLEHLRATLGTQHLNVHEGWVWTTDAPFRETVGKVSRYREQGILGVEMEASALFTVAHYRGIRLASVMVVSDELATLKWTHGFREARFKETRERLVELTLDLVCSTLQALRV